MKKICLSDNRQVQQDKDDVLCSLLAVYFSDQRFERILKFYREKNQLSVELLADRQALWIHLVHVEKIFDFNKNYRDVFYYIYELFKKHINFGLKLGVDLSNNENFKNDYQTVLLMVILQSFLFKRKINLDIKHQRKQNEFIWSNTQRDIARSYDMVDVYNFTITLDDERCNRFPFSCVEIVPFTNFNNHKKLVLNFRFRNLDNLHD